MKLPASLASFSADYPRPIRVVAIGAGLSGIVSAIRLNQRIPNVSIQVYDKNADIGGTWYENRYPGCACDIPSYSYQATFEPSLTWSQFYAPSEEIFRYWKGIVAKYDCERYMKLRHEIVEAKWDEASCKWTLKVSKSCCAHNGTTSTDPPRLDTRSCECHRDRGCLRYCHFRYWTIERFQVARHPRLALVQGQASP